MIAMFASSYNFPIILLFWYLIGIRYYFSCELQFTTRIFPFEVVPVTIKIPMLAAAIHRSLPLCVELILESEADNSLVNSDFYCLHGSSCKIHI